MSKYYFTSQSYTQFARASALHTQTYASVSSSSITLILVSPSMYKERVGEISKHIDALLNIFLFCFPSGSLNLCLTACVYFCLETYILLEMKQQGKFCECADDLNEKLSKERDDDPVPAFVIISSSLEKPTINNFTKLENSH